ncbi:MAG: CYCXC family (seleno)protein [Pyrinomonadaceae bacterium]
MKNRILWIVVSVLVLGVAGLLLAGSSENRPAKNRETAVESKPRSAESQPAASHSETAHSHSPAIGQVPAFQTASQAQQLAPTLTPAQFVGKTREAYMVAKQIPQTLAQLPCYCHCDQSFGHKSLQTCFVDDHAAHCAVCVDEALLAYRLQKEQRLTPEQVREIIIEKYSDSQ